MALLYSTLTQQQRCQVSRIARESHAFEARLTHQGPKITHHFKIQAHALRSQTHSLLAVANLSGLNSTSVLL